MNFDKLFKFLSRSNLIHILIIFNFGGGPTQYIFRATPSFVIRGYSWQSWGGGCLWWSGVNLNFVYRAHTQVLWVFPPAPQFKFLFWFLIHTWLYSVLTFGSWLSVSCTGSRVELGSTMHKTSILSTVLSLAPSTLVLGGPPILFIFEDTSSFALRSLLVVLGELCGARESSLLHAKNVLILLRFLSSPGFVCDSCYCGCCYFEVTLSNAQVLTPSSTIKNYCWLYSDNHKSSEIKPGLVTYKNKYSISCIPHPEICF